MMTSSQTGPVTYAMADFSCQARWDAFPSAVQNEAARSWLNWMACAVGGAVTPSVDTVMRGLQSIGGGSVPVLGRVETTSLSDAALLGSLSAAAHTFDDTHLATITHPTGPVAGAVLATAYQLGEQDRPVSGLRMLTALAVGIELECRLSCAIAAGKSHPGWYMTGLSGGVGAAAGAGYLLGLSKQQMVYALGLAAAQASGMRATHGSMAINFVPGIAARDGLVAAHLAAVNYTCSDIALDGKNSLLQVLTGQTDSSLIEQELGVRYEMLNNAYKPYPCGIVIHPAIDACLALVKQHQFSHEEIKKIELHVYADALNLCWRKLPDNVLDAQVSLFHWIAAALVFKKAGVEQGELAAVQDSRVRGLQERAQAQPDDRLGNTQARVVLHLSDGRVLEHFVEDATGSVTNPMTDAQLATKFQSLVTPVLGELRGKALFNKCLSMETVHGAAELLQLGALSS